MIKSNIENLNIISKELEQNQSLYFNSPLCFIMIAIIFFAAAITGPIMILLETFFVITIFITRLKIFEDILDIIYYFYDLMTVPFIIGFIYFCL